MEEEPLTPPNLLMELFNKGQSSYRLRLQRVEEVKREMYRRYRHESQLALELNYLKQLQADIIKHK